MSGRHSYSDLTSTFSPAVRRRIAETARKEGVELPFHRIRWARHLALKHTAKALRIKEDDMAEMERRADAYIAHLRSQVEEMGGQLRFVAEFPEGEVAITGLAEIGDPVDDAGG